MLLPETIKIHDPDKYEFHCIYFLPWKNQMVGILESLGVIVTCLNARNNIELMLKAEKVIAYVNNQNIGLIHCHLPWAGFLGRYVHFRLKCSVLYTEHNKQERYHFITSWLNKRTFNYQTRAIAVSQDVSSSIYQNIKPKIPIETIKNGVNTEYFKKDENQRVFMRQKYNIPEHGILVGTVAVFRFQKRLKEWLHVISQARLTSNQIYGVIVGAGPLYDEVRQERDNLGLEDCVLMPGLQTNMVDWYSTMDIFMMSSIYEGLPVSMLEAMSMSCPVISTDAGGIKEILIPGETGLLVEIDEWQKLTDCLLKMVDHELRSQIGQNGRQFVKVNLSINHMVKGLEGLYDDVIQKESNDSKDS